MRVRTSPYHLAMRARTFAMADANRHVSGALVHADFSALARRIRGDGVGGGASSYRVIEAGKSLV